MKYDKLLAKSTKQKHALHKYLSSYKSAKSTQVQLKSKEKVKNKNRVRLISGGKIKVCFFRCETKRNGIKQNTFSA